MTNQEKPGWVKRLMVELKKLSVTVVYLWVLFSVFFLYRSIILSDYHISQPERLGFALLNALILAKFMLIAEAFHVGDRADSQPLLYSIIFKSAVFATILMMCHVLEEVLVRAWNGTSIGQSLPDLSRATLVETLSIGIIMFVVLIPFFSTKEIIRVLGKGEVKSLLFARRANVGRSDSGV